MGIICTQDGDDGGHGSYLTTKWLTAKPQSARRKERGKKVEGEKQKVDLCLDFVETDCLQIFKNRIVEFFLACMVFFVT
jgi:hypothetical protein